MKKIAIFCGGPSSEHEVSLLSAKSILENIDRKKYTPFIFFIQKNSKSAYYKAGKVISPPKDTEFKEFEKVLKENKKNIDIALLSALHGEFGEDGTIQLILENLGIRYTGSNSKASQVCIDKLKTYEKVKGINGISFPKTVNVALQNLQTTPPIKFPFIIKPNSLGSSVLVFIVKNQKEYEKAISEIKKSKVNDLLFQELIEGIEFSCGCLENKKGEFTLLPPIEIRPKNSDFFNYDAKYIAGESEEITPPVSISKNVSNQISKITAEIHKKLKCSTFSRSDFIYKNKKLYFLEINTLPGMTATSLLPKEAKAYGISFTKLLDFMIREAK